MRGVKPPFGDGLRMQFQRFAIEPLLRVIGAHTAAVDEAREHVGCVEKRLPPLYVVPDVHRLVAFDDGVRPDAAAPVRPVLVRDTDVAALVIPLPAVERTLQDVALDVSSIPEMRAEGF